MMPKRANKVDGVYCNELSNQFCKADGFNIASQLVMPCTRGFELGGLKDQALVSCERLKNETGSLLASTLKTCGCRACWLWMFCVRHASMRCTMAYSNYPRHRPRSPSRRYDAGRAPLQHN